MTHPFFDATRDLARRYREARRGEPSLSAEQFLARQTTTDHDRRGIPREQWVELLDVLRNAPERELDELITEWLDRQLPKTAADGAHTHGVFGDAAGEKATLPLQEHRSSGDDPESTIKTAEPPPAQDAGTIDRRYRIVRVLGEGAFGKVFLVRDRLQNEQELALKLIKKEHTATSEALVRFRNEILLLRALSHRGIPQIFNDGMTEDGEFYYTMAYVAGRTLDDVIRKEAPLDPLRIVRITKQVLDVLDYAHGRGAIHRDLKPGNIFLLHAGTPKEEVRVLDFGIAKVLSREGILEHAQTMHTENPLGTPHYMSPEQVRGADVDGRTDLYALGVILYQMCSGRFPFSGKTLMEILAARLERPPNPLEDKTTPAWLRELVMKLLERERERRPDTQSIRVALEQLQGSHRDLSRRITWIAAAGAITVGLLAWAIFFRGEKPVDEHASGPRPEAPGASTPKTGTESSTDPKSAPSGGESNVGENEAGKPPAGEAANVGQVPPESPAKPDPAQGSPEAAKPASQAPVEHESANGAPAEKQDAPVDSGKTSTPAAPPALALVELDPPMSPMPSFGPEVKRVRFTGRATRKLSAVRIGAATVEPDANDPLRFEADVPLPDPPMDGKDADLALKVELIEADTFERAELSINYRRRAARIPPGCSPAPDAAVDERGRVTSVFEGKSRLLLALVDEGPDKPGFYLGRTEVSCDEWNRGPLNRLEWGAAQEGRPGDHPAVAMSFESATHYCEARGLRLPTTAEWERAAALAGGKGFPWGDAFEPGACNSNDPGDTFREAAPVGSFPKDKCGPFLDLAGNVQEWCVDASTGKPALRGGSWRLAPNACKLTAKGVAPKDGSVSIGLRVAVTSPP